MNVNVNVKGGVVHHRASCSLRMGGCAGQGTWLEVVSGRLACSEGGTPLTHSAHFHSPSGTYEGGVRGVSG
jgi:hypothetical protein